MLTISRADLVGLLHEAGVAEGDTAMLHSSLQRSARVEGRRSAEKIETVTRAMLDAVGAGGRLVMPTFTYSFCEGEPYDARTTPSTVGQLTEAFRSRPGVRRSWDPIFSTAVAGAVPREWETRLFAPGDVDCFGPRSVFALLLEQDALLLFYDVSFELCTFVHHVEQALEVPYRYLKRFEGRLLTEQGPVEARADFFVRRLDEEVETYLTPLWDALRTRGDTREHALEGGPTVRSVRARAVDAEIRRRIAAEPDFLLRRGHTAVA